MVSGPDSTLDCADVCASTASRFGSPPVPTAWPIWPEYAASPGGFEDIRLGLGGTSGGADFLPVAGRKWEGVRAMDAFETHATYSIALTCRGERAAVAKNRELRILPYSQVLDRKQLLSMLQARKFHCGFNV